MTEVEAIQKKIIRILAEKAHVKTPSPTANLLETGRLDSLTLVELIVGIEEEFKIQVPFEAIEIDHFRSVQSIADFVTKQLQLNRLSRLGAMKTGDPERLEEILENRS